MQVQPIILVFWEIIVFKCLDVDLCEHIPHPVRGQCYLCRCVDHPQTAYTLGCVSTSTTQEEDCAICADVWITPQTAYILGCVSLFPHPVRRQCYLCRCVDRPQPVYILGWSFHQTAWYFTSTIITACCLS